MSRGRSVLCSPARCSVPGRPSRPCPSTWGGPGREGLPTLGTAAFAVVLVLGVAMLVTAAAILGPVLR